MAEPPPSGGRSGSASSRPGSGTNSGSGMLTFLPVMLLRDIEHVQPRDVGAGYAPRHAALVYVDVVGFSQISNQLHLKTEDGSGSLSRNLGMYLDRIVRVVVEHGGDVILFSGDALLAAWPSPVGASVQHTRCARDAILCGAALIKACSGFTFAARTTSGAALRQEMSVRIGAAAGRVISCIAGGAAPVELGRWRHVFLGRPVDEVGRATNSTPAGTFAMTHEVADLARLHVDLVADALPGGEFVQYSSHSRRGRPATAEASSDLALPFDSKLEGEDPDPDEAPPSGETTLIEAFTSASQRATTWQSVAQVLEAVARSAPDAQEDGAADEPPRPAADVDDPLSASIASRLTNPGQNDSSSVTGSSHSEPASDSSDPRRRSAAPTWATNGGRQSIATAASRVSIALSPRAGEGGPTGSHGSDGFVSAMATSSGLGPSPRASRHSGNSGSSGPPNAPASSDTSQLAVGTPQPRSPPIGRDKPTRLSSGAFVSSHSTLEQTSPQSPHSSNGGKAGAKGGEELQEHASLLEKLSRSVFPRAVRHFLFEPLYRATKKWEEGQVGDLRTVSTVFVKMRSTPQLDDEPLSFLAVHKALRIVQKLLTPLAGIVNKVVMDDKGVIIVVVFGLPGYVHDNDVERSLLFAVKAAKAFQLQGLSAAFGMSRAHAYCGVIGSKWRQEYTVLGNGINIAARLMSKADELLSRHALKPELAPYLGSSDGGSPTNQPSGEPLPPVQIICEEETALQAESSKSAHRFAVCHGGEFFLKGQEVHLPWYSVHDAEGDVTAHRPSMPSSGSDNTPVSPAWQSPRARLLETRTSSEARASPASWSSMGSRPSSTRSSRLSSRISKRSMFLASPSNTSLSRSLATPQADTLLTGGFPPPAVALGAGAGAVPAASPGEVPPAEKGAPQSCPSLQEATLTQFMAAVRASPLVLLRGGAQSGKSSLLQRACAQLAAAEHPPLIVPLAASTLDGLFAPLRPFVHALLDAVFAPSGDTWGPEGAAPWKFEVAHALEVTARVGILSEVVVHPGLPPPAVEQLALDAAGKVNAVVKQLLKLLQCVANQVVFAVDGIGGCDEGTLLFLLRAVEETSAEESVCGNPARFKVIASAAPIGLAAAAGQAHLLGAATDSPDDASLDADTPVIEVHSPEGSLDARDPAALRQHLDHAAVTVAVQPLTREETKTLLTFLFWSDVDAALVDTVHRKTGGIVGFVCSVVWALIDDALVATQHGLTALKHIAPGRWYGGVAKGVASAEAHVLRFLDTAGPHEAEVLQACAVASTDGAFHLMDVQAVFATGAPPQNASPTSPRGSPPGNPLMFLGRRRHSRMLSSSGKLRALSVSSAASDSLPSHSQRLSISSSAAERRPSAAPPGVLGAALASMVQHGLIAAVPGQAGTFHFPVDVYRDLVCQNMLLSVRKDAYAKAYAAAAEDWRGGRGGVNASTVAYHGGRCGAAVPAWVVYEAFLDKVAAGDYTGAEEVMRLLDDAADAPGSPLLAAAPPHAGRWSRTERGTAWLKLVMRLNAMSFRNHLHYVGAAQTLQEANAVYNKAVARLAGRAADRGRGRDPKKDRSPLFIKKSRAVRKVRNARDFLSRAKQAKPRQKTEVREKRAQPLSWWRRTFRCCGGGEEGVVSMGCETPKTHRDKSSMCPANGGRDADSLGDDLDESSSNPGRGARHGGARLRDAPGTDLLAAWAVVAAEAAFYAGSKSSLVDVLKRYREVREEKEVESPSDDAPPDPFSGVAAAITVMTESCTGSAGRDATPRQVPLSGGSLAASVPPLVGRLPGSAEDLSPAALPGALTTLVATAARGEYTSSLTVLALFHHPAPISFISEEIPWPLSCPERRVSSESATTYALSETNPLAGLQNVAYPEHTSPQRSRPGAEPVPAGVWTGAGRPDAWCALLGMKVAVALFGGVGAATAMPEGVTALVNSGSPKWRQVGHLLRRVAARYYSHPLLTSDVQKLQLNAARLENPTAFRGVPLDDADNVLRPLELTQQQSRFKNLTMNLRQCIDDATRVVNVFHCLSVVCMADYILAEQRTAIHTDPLLGLLRQVAKQFPFLGVFVHYFRALSSDLFSLEDGMAAHDDTVTELLERFVDEAQRHGMQQSVWVWRARVLLASKKGTLAHHAGILIHEYTAQRFAGARGMLSLCEQARDQRAAGSTGSGSAAESD